MAAAACDAFPLPRPLGPGFAETPQDGALPNFSGAVLHARLNGIGEESDMAAEAGATFS